MLIYKLASTHNRDFHSTVFYCKYCLEDRNVAVDLGPMSLCDTLGYPDDIPTLLFFELHEGIKYTQIELLHEGILHQVHLCKVQLDLINIQRTEARAILHNVIQPMDGKIGGGPIHCRTYYIFC